MKKYQLGVLVAAIALASPLSRAATGLENIHWSGFLNAVGEVSDSETPYLEHIDEDGSFNATSYGLNATAKLNDRLTIAGQFFGGGHGGDEVSFDWGFARYKFSDAITGKAGKIKYPGNLVSEYFDVGFAYPWVRPPEVIYSEQAELFFEAYKGGAALFEGGADTFDYSLEVYGGQASEDHETHDKMIAAVASISNDYGMMQAGYNRSDLDAPGTMEDGREKKTWTVGATADWNNLVFYSEYARSEIENMPMHDMKGWFATLGYRFGNTMPHLTYQSYDMDSGIEQTSWTLGVKQQLGRQAALKLEWQRVSDIESGGLFEAQPDDSDVNFFNTALNFVF